MTTEQLLSTKRFGLIIRTFASKPELVKAQVEAVKETFFYAFNMCIGTRPVFSRIDILVSADESRMDSDCGKTALEIRDFLFGEEILGNGRVFVSEVKHGDIFCGLLNYGIAHQLRDRIDYSFIVSTQVRSYLTEATVMKMIQAVADGAKVSGVALEELSDSIRKGRIANTFAMWDNVALMTVGGFDLRAAKPRKDEKLVHHLQGWSPEKGEVFYHFAGVEEIIPLIRLIRTFGPCIAPVLPDEESAKRWVAADPVKDPEGYARNLKKMGTKEQRQTAFAALENADLSFLEGGVMDQYRKK